MSSTPSSLSRSMCANCGKGEESSGDLKACTACKMVKYCNRNCQIAHRPQHKKACKKRAAELYDAALFEELAPEECPQYVCYLRQFMKSIQARRSFYAAGKIFVMAVFMQGLRRLVRTSTFVHSVGHHPQVHMKWKSKDCTN